MQDLTLYVKRQALLAVEIDISDSHLSRVLRRADYKTPSPDLMRKVTIGLVLSATLPEDQDAFPRHRG